MFACPNARIKFRWQKTLLFSVTFPGFSKLIGTGLINSVLLHADRLLL